jgi:flagellar basal body L-ring protein FlgH
MTRVFVALALLALAACGTEAGDPRPTTPTEKATTTALPPTTTTIFRDPTTMIQG